MATREGVVELRRLESLDEFQATAELQRRVWGFDESDLVAPRLFGVFTRTGGSCLGAFLDGRLVGFALALAAFKRDGRPYWHSHMAAVEPALHHRGIGFLLKQLQRREAMEAGLDLIEWTFDPLQSRNAYFNLEKLGVEIEGYLPNFYGVTSSDLHGALPTDRLVAAWHLASRRTAARLAGQPARRVAGSATIEIPTRISEVSRTVAAGIQERVRTQFQDAFARRLRVAWFERTPESGIYHLARRG